MSFHYMFQITVIISLKILLRSTQWPFDQQNPFPLIDNLNGTIL